MESNCVEGRRLLLVSQTTGYQTRAFADAATRLGVRARLATDRCHILEDPWADSAIPVRFEALRWSLRKVHDQAPFDGIAAVGDRPALLASYIARDLGLRFSPPEAVAASRNKFLTRERFRAAGLPVPEFHRIPLEADSHEAARSVPYPCVLKPLGLSASRGVIRADDRQAFLAAFSRIRRLLAMPDICRFREDSDRYVQVEAFVPGREYAVEGIVSGGRLQVLAIFDKPDPLDGPFFEETIYVTPSRAAARIRHAIAAAAQKAVAGLGLTWGPVHAEARVNDSGVWVLEVAARPIGGLCARALRFQDGIPLEDAIVRHALGGDISGLRREKQASGVMMILIPAGGIYHKVHGLEQASATAGVEEILITAKQGQELVPLPEGSSYLGFIFARGESPGLVETSLRAAHARLQFEILAKLPVAP